MISLDTCGFGPHMTRGDPKFPPIPSVPSEWRARRCNSCAGGWLPGGTLTAPTFQILTGAHQRDGGEEGCVGEGMSFPDPLLSPHSKSPHARPPPLPCLALADFRAKQSRLSNSVRHREGGPSVPPPGAGLPLRASQLPASGSKFPRT